LLTTGEAARVAVPIGYRATPEWRLTAATAVRWCALAHRRSDAYARGRPRGAGTGGRLSAAGGKTHNADKTISIDQTTLAALRRLRDRQNREREFFGADYHPGDYVFTFDNGRPPHSHSIRQRFDRLAAAAGLSRITFRSAPLLRDWHAESQSQPEGDQRADRARDVGFFLETYAHVLKNDDRDAAKQAASFLVGDGWDSESDDE
jgi:hypothetical protein